MKKIITLYFMLGVITSGLSQFAPYTFGKGIHLYDKDSSFHMKFGLRFQNQYSHQWDVRNDDLGNIGDYKGNFLVRRARLKWDGYLLSKKLKYKVELGLSNRDLSGGDSREYGNASRLILDSWVEWNFVGNFSLWGGQGKMPGNRERLVSSGNMQFVDRSRLNSRFTLDRDMGVMLKHHFTLGDQFLVKEIVSMVQGEGRNVTTGYKGGYNYTFKVEFFPFGDFQSKGAYVCSDLKREQKPKLAVAVAYDINNNAVRERGQLGAYIQDSLGVYSGKTINTLFADMMFKYKGFSLMAEYANRKTKDHDPHVYDASNNLMGTFYTGQALNVQAGYLFKNNYEIAGRITTVRPNEQVGPNENEYGLAFSKYFVGHKLKLQTDLNYRQNYYYGNTAPNQGKNDGLYWRVQMDIHF
ncbi:MAG: porin [Crocinitomicaceae bacterium]